MAKYSHRNSTAIASFDYDDKTQTLNISFTKGGSHSYQVPESVAEGLSNAASKGSYFNEVVRNGGYG